MSDRLREFAIWSCTKVWLIAYRMERSLAQLHKELIFGRSTTQVARMEQRMRLR